MAKTMPGFFWKQLREDMSRIVPPALHTPDPSKWPDTGVHGAWLGHSTALVKVDGFTILTDPVFHNWIGVDLRLATVGMKRLVGPALPISKLPKIDLILSSHAHMDHLDLASVRELENRKTEVVMAKQTSDLVRGHRFKQVRELGWGEKLQVGPVAIRGLEVRHWGARVRTDTYRGYGGYELDFGNRRLLFAGDTADTDAFRRQRNGKIDLAIMPIGAYNPWVYAHCNPEQALRMVNDFGAEKILPIHHQTFALSKEPLKEPIERLQEALGAHQDRIVLREIGQEFSLT